MDIAQEQRELIEMCKKIDFLILDIQAKIESISTEDDCAEIMECCHEIDELIKKRNQITTDFALDLKLAGYQEPEVGQLLKLASEANQTFEPLCNLVK